jgi:catechol 2,3-dioxygenase-like lactoylglutathione lyase family enzyme
MADNHPALQTAPTPQPAPLSRVLETCLYVTDLAAAEAFYRDILGLALHSGQDGRQVFFRCGEQMVLLFNAEVSSQPPTEGLPIPTHGARGEGHLCFAVRLAELPAWQTRLETHGVAIERTIDWPGGRSIYFRDPAGNCLELATPRIWGLSEESLTAV